MAHAFCVFAYCLRTNGRTNRKKYNLPASSKERRERERIWTFSFASVRPYCRTDANRRKVQFFFFYRSFMFQVLFVTCLKFSHRRHHYIYIWSEDDVNRLKMKNDKEKKKEQRKIYMNIIFRLDAIRNEKNKEGESFVSKKKCQYTTKKKAKDSYTWCILL